MTVTNTDRKITYTGNGATTAWAYSFNIPDAASAVVQTEIIATGVVTVIDAADYTITGLGSATGGSVTYPKAGDPLASTVKITVYRAVPATQGISVANQTAYNAGVVEKVWDRLTLIAQDQAEESARSITMPITFDGATPNFPVPSEGKVIQWENNLLINGPDAAQIAAANAEAVAAAASASAASGFATAAGLSADEAAAYAAGLIGGTGVVTDFTVTSPNGGTVFTISALSATIHSRVANVTIVYAGAADVTIANLAVSSTYVYLDSSGVLQQQGTKPTREDWSQKVFLVRIAVDTVAGTVIGFEYLSNTIGHYSNTIRDFYDTLLAQGIPFKVDQVITGNSGNLKWNVGEGKAFELGGNGDIHNPNFVPFDAVANAEYTLMERTLAGTGGQTDLVKFWDNAGSITPLGSGTFVAHRLYRFSSGNFVIQYGQGNYADLALAKIGVLQEEYVLNSLLVNATFFGWWFIGETATNSLGVDGLTQFIDYTIGAQGGSANALFAPVNSPTFTGVPAAPTAAPGTDTTQVATTAFIAAAIAAIDIGALIAALPLGAVGTFATLFEKVASTTPITEGDTRNGSALAYNGAYWNGTLGGSWQGSAAGTSPSGIWQLQGLNTSTAGVRRGGVWKRIS
jgi:hypothetical protein